MNMNQKYRISMDFKRLYELCNNKYTNLKYILLNLPSFKEYGEETRLLDVGDCTLNISDLRE